MLEVIVLTSYAGLMVALTVYSLLQLQLTWLRGRALAHGLDDMPSSDPATLPFVTVQVPIYNEMHVVERILDHVAALDYPRDRLEIQVLDDSTDATRQIIDVHVRALAGRGVPIRIVRRSARTGFKAGALREGLVAAQGELVAVFDADFLPRPDFLRRTVPWFEERRLAVVQARWGYVNARQSLLTRIQELFLDVHFTVEQTGRASNGLFANFNGTAGVWRRSAIVDAGGWRDDTLTEDMDLSYRAQLRGWRIRYLEHYDAPSELPVDLAAFRSQQFRWMKGGAENARLHVRNIARSSLPWRTKVHACAHLLSSSVYLVLLGALVLSVPMTFLKNTWIRPDYVHFGMVFFGATIALVLVYHASRGAEARGLSGKLRFAGMMALFLVFTMGLALHNGVAVVRGWLGERSEFKRTPKYGALVHGRAWAKSEYVLRRLEPIVLGEIALLTYLLVGIGHGVRVEDYGFVPIQAMAIAGLAWVLGLTLGQHARVAARVHATRDEGGDQPAFCTASVNRET